MLILVAAVRGCGAGHCGVHVTFAYSYTFFFNDTATTNTYTLSLHDALPILSNDGSNKLNRSRKARVSYKVQRTINASLNAATSTRAVSSNPNFVTRQKIEIIFG